MRYMLLIYGDESEWAGEPGPEALEPWMKYSEEAKQAGVMESGAGLLPTATATTVRVRNGKAISTDGPFAETKEQLGGFYILDCEDLDEALSWAAKIPSVGTGSVEVRPVMEPPQS